MSIFTFLPAWLLPEDILFAGALIVATALFLREFKLTSRSGWAVLAGFTSMGGILTYRIWQRKQFLEHFVEREKELEQLKEDYQQLEIEAEISREDYERAMQELEAAKMRAVQEIAAINAKLQGEIRAIQTKYGDLTPDQSAEKLKEILARIS